MSTGTTQRKETAPSEAAPATIANPVASLAESKEAKAALAKANEVFNTASNQLLQKADQFLSKSPLLQQWKSRRPFLQAQGQVLMVLVVALIVNNWPVSYPRENNHSDFMFWTMTLAMIGAAFYTLKHEKGRSNRVQLLSRAQTEEWKGWMQFVFIMVRKKLRMFFLCQRFTVH